MGWIGEKMQKNPKNLDIENLGEINPTLSAWWCKQKDEQMFGCSRGGDNSDFNLLALLISAAHHLPGSKTKGILPYVLEKHYLT